MVNTRPIQLLLPLFEASCLVCWQVFSEGILASRDLRLPQPPGEGLCTNHRARLEEGACLYCGCRLAWLRMAGKPELAFCRPCFVRQKGEAVALAVDAIREGDTIPGIVS